MSACEWFVVPQMNFLWVITCISINVKLLLNISADTVLVLTKLVFTSLKFKLKTLVNTGPGCRSSKRITGHCQKWTLDSVTAQAGNGYGTHKNWVRIS